MTEYLVHYNNNETDEEKDIVLLAPTFAHAMAWAEDESGEWEVVSVVPVGVC